MRHFFGDASERLRYSATRKMVCRDGMMEKTLFRFIWKHSLRQQIFIVAWTVISFPFLYYSLDLPKMIVNESIQGKHWPLEILGFPLGQMEHLIVLSVSYLGLVLINGAFKYFLNVYKGRVGERMNRRLRFALYERILRFPNSHFRKTPPGQLVPMITAEVEPLGGFIGDSFAVPAFQGGTLLVILVFMCLQDPILGLAAIALYPFQIIVIPRLQRKVNNLSKQRIHLVRELSDEITETALSLREIQTNGTNRFHLALFSKMMDINYWIRFDIFKWKFFIKFLNNFIAQLTPFFFYSIGGYLVIKGSLSLGALLAVVAAYKDLNAPWRELLDYYQSMEDARIKYEQVVDQFDPMGMIPPDRAPIDADARPHAGTPSEVAMSNVSMTDDGGNKRLDALSLTVPPGQRLALLGPDTGGKHDLLQLLAGQAAPETGRVLLDGVSPLSLSIPDLGRRIGYVGGETVMRSGTLYENLVYGLQWAPAALPADPEWPAKRKEAERTGNSTDPSDVHWVDVTQFGPEGRAAFKAWLRQVLEMTGMLSEVREFGLQGRVDPLSRPEIVDLVLRSRQALRPFLSAPALASYIEPFAADRFNSQSTLAENLLFGTPVGPTFHGDGLARHPVIRGVLRAEGIEDALVQAGRATAQTLSEIFRDLPPTHEFYARFSFVDAEELADLEQVEARVRRDGVMTPADRTRFLTLILRLIPARHRLDTVDDALMTGIVKARARLMRDLPDDLRSAVDFFDENRFSPINSLLDNVLFGRLAPGQNAVNSRMRQLVRTELERLDLLRPLGEAALIVGLETPVGVGGSRLSPAMRQRVAIARALIKRPPLLLFDDPAALMDQGLQQTMIDAILAEPHWTVIWALQRPLLAKTFDRVVVLDDGQIAADGPAAEIVAAKEAPGRRAQAE
ncbi:hypothetical protein GCM10011497_15230 [Elstera cyanobacteriorum]|nr:hypothetical protein GCM10011497_15230 [Elstera cyanobacteriorum]